MIREINPRMEFIERIANGIFTMIVYAFIGAVGTAFIGGLLVLFFYAIGIIP